MTRNVGQLMTTDPTVVTPSTRFKEIVRKLTEHGISALPVVGEDERLIGIVSEEDLIQKEAEPKHDQEPLFEGRKRRQRRMKAAGVSASELMTPAVISIGPAASLEEAAKRMTEHHVKRLPVVDESDRLLGVISRVDLLKVFLRDDGEIRQEVVERAVAHSINEGARDVRIDVEDGEVILRGHVVRRSLAEGIAEFASVIEGVVAVHNAIEYDDDDVDAGAYAWVGSVMTPGRW